MGTDIEIVDGVLMKPNLHDACIFGLKMSENGDLAISIRLENGLSADFILSEVCRLLVNNFREGNVILDVIVVRAGQIELSDIEFFYGPDAVDISDSILSLYRQVKLNGNILVKIHTSYGCEISCICDGVGFVERP